MRGMEIVACLRVRGASASLGRTNTPYRSFTGLNLVSIVVYRTDAEIGGRLNNRTTLSPEYFLARYDWPGRCAGLFIAGGSTGKESSALFATPASAWVAISEPAAAEAATQIDRADRPNTMTHRRLSS